MTTCDGMHSPEYRPDQKRGVSYGNLPVGPYIVLDHMDRDNGNGLYFCLCSRTDRCDAKKARLLDTFVVDWLGAPTMHEAPRDDIVITGWRMPRFECFPITSEQADRIFMLSVMGFKFDRLAPIYHELTGVPDND